MSSILSEALLILVLLTVNGIFAMSELAIVSARKIRLQQRAEEGDRKAQVALELASTPERFLSTVQIGITLIGILAGAFGGATIAEQLAAAFSHIPLLAPYSEGIGLGLVVLVITYLSLIIGELVPKQIALSQPERIAVAIAIPMRLLSRIASPIVHLLSGSSRFLIRLLGIRPSDEPVVTEAEVRMMIEQGTEAGMFEVAERDMINKVFRLADRRVGALLTPRTDVVWLDIAASPEVIRHTIIESVHSRFPVARGNLDNFLGIVHAKDLLAQILAGKPVDLESVLTRPLFVPESAPALKALELFKEHRTTLALVLDEYGGLEGLVTVNDLIASIIGEIPQAHAPTEPGAVQREDGSWLLDGMTSVDAFKGLLGLEDLPGEASGNFRTVAGFVLSFLEHITTPGEHFEWNGLRIEVVDMDGNRIDKVLVSRVTSDHGAI